VLPAHQRAVRRARANPVRPVAAAVRTGRPAGFLDAERWCPAAEPVRPAARPVAAAAAGRLAATAADLGRPAATDLGRPATTGLAGRSAAAGLAGRPATGTATGTRPAGRHELGRPGLMGRLIKAEFRKIVTTKLWLGLLLTALVVALLWAWMWSSAFDEIARDINRDLRRYAAVDLNDLSVNAIFLTRAINIATIFPMIFGGMALAVEIGRKTITTSFLTAPNRGTLLGAKAITYVLWGAIFGVVIILGASLGLLFGVGGEGMVDGEMWITIAASGLLSCVLWTLLGLGVGALIGSSVGTVVVLLVYGLLVGPGMDMTFAAISASNSEEIGPTVAGAFPNGA